MQNIPVKIKLLDKEAKVPTYGSEEAAGFDLYSIEEAVIEPGKTKMFRTGISLEVQSGICWQFWDRSSLGSKGIHRFAGLIDSDYRGEFKVILFNSTDQPFKINKGDRIVQVIPVPFVKTNFEITEKLSETQRNQGGFGSTGK